MTPERKITFRRERVSHHTIITRRNLPVYKAAGERTGFAVKEIVPDWGEESPVGGVVGRLLQSAIHRVTRALGSNCVLISVEWPESAKNDDLFWEKIESLR